MKSLLNNNIAVNQTAVRKLRFKHETVLAGNGCFISNKQNAPPNFNN
jgi:hypothetical protein